MNKDEEIGRVTAQLDALLDKLRDNVDALNAILTTEPPPPGGVDDERLVKP